MDKAVIDSEVAAMLLGVSKVNLRQLVFTKVLVPVGRKNRRSLFNLQDVVDLQTKRDKA